ncbi:Mediator of RNA polymerase II transcription subunit 4 [Acorus calamus]|uniref:Mediator of RNA polymerase II transcription subunit 4 n=1 Tax=Acorus calamus TaxID=4465 RepID=A0AAV9FKR5_ACOCL|nr:Mediator of RNA polymerase II transcription subunit 4 [Acorus calamus]
MLQSHVSHILPSPARLGLTPANPNSPNPTTSSSSVPAAAPPPPTKLPTSTSSTAIAASTTLLSLHPPLARAQTLLLQMSLLASKLFEVSPNRSLWVSFFRGSLPSFIPSSQSQTLIPSLPPLSSPKEVLSLFTSLQTQLFEAVAELQEILDLQDAKTRLSRDVRSMDASLLAFSKKVHEAEQVLDSLVDDYADYTSLPDNKRLKSGIGLSDILSYAHRISYTTFAPPEFGAGQAPLRGALPPAPQDEQMRASQLYRFADLDVGVPGAAEGVDRTAVEALIEVERTPPAEAAAQAAVPPTWMKGLPDGFPKVPKGWKPGDPVPLPPLEPTAKVEERPPVVTAPRAPPPPEVIQVRHVQLDIDQDEYSSDYSSEVGSSEEDDED